MQKNQTKLFFIEIEQCGVNYKKAYGAKIPKSTLEGRI